MKEDRALVEKFIMKSEEGRQKDLEVLERAMTPMTRRAGVARARAATEEDEQEEQQAASGGFLRSLLGFSTTHNKTPSKKAKVAESEDAKPAARNLEEIEEESESSESENDETLSESEDVEAEEKSTEGDEQAEAAVAQWYSMSKAELVEMLTKAYIRQSLDDLQLTAAFQACVDKKLVH